MTRSLQLQNASDGPLIHQLISFKLSKMTNAGKKAGSLTGRPRGCTGMKVLRRIMIRLTKLRRLSSDQRTGLCYPNALEEWQAASKKIIANGRMRMKVI